MEKNMLDLTLVIKKNGKTLDEVLDLANEVGDSIQKEISTKELLACAYEKDYANSFSFKVVITISLGENKYITAGAINFICYNCADEIFGVNIIGYGTFFYAEKDSELLLEWD